jgi:hypothetical protein
MAADLTITANDEQGISTEVAARLAALGLSALDQQALARQGFVAAEYRPGQGRRLGPYFKLRWRRDGRQQVRYLGCDLDWARQIQAALANLQRPRQLIRQVNGLMKEARKRLHQAKDLLEPRLGEGGQYYHGYTARRSAKEVADGPRRQRADEREQGAV